MIKLLVLIAGILLLRNYTEVDLASWLYLNRDIALAMLFAVIVSPWVIGQIEA